MALLCRPYVSSTFLNILAVPSNAVFCSNSYFECHFSNHFPKAPTPKNLLRYFSIFSFFSCILLFPGSAMSRIIHLFSLLSTTTISGRLQLCDHTDYLHPTTPNICHSHLRLRGMCIPFFLFSLIVFFTKLSMYNPGNVVMTSFVFFLGQYANNNSKAFTFFTTYCT